MIGSSPGIRGVLGLERTNTILYCRRWSETVHFYKAQLRLPVSFENDWFVEFQLMDSAFLSIANAARASIQDAQGQGVTLTWKVADLPLAKQLLDQQGITTTAIKHRWQALVLYLFDPEGHRIELWADLDGRDEQAL